MCFKTRGLYKCGHCPECLQERRIHWTLRLMEQKNHSSCFSALLTYNNEHLHLTVDGLMSLCKRDVQLFLKRLRHVQGFQKIKYYIAGEYSPEKFRPHYHCIFFGIDKDYEKDEIISTLQKTWQNGFVGSRSNWVKDDAQLGYATGYIINLYEWKIDDKRERPFNLISKGLGLGDSMLPKLVVKHASTSYDPLSRVFVTDNPAYYDTETHMLVFDDDFPQDSFVVKVQQTKFDPRSRKTTFGPVHTYPIPRSWRDKLLTYEDRQLLLMHASLKKFKELEVYYRKYGSYDLTAEMPMWQQIKRQKWQQRKKSKKDKLLSNPDIYFL